MIRTSIATLAFAALLGTGIASAQGTPSSTTTPSVTAPSVTAPAKPVTGKVKHSHRHVQAKAVKTSAKTVTQSKTVTKQ